jgi:hypothetical protein
MDVKIKDRNFETESLRIALNMAEVSVTYIVTDLILKVQKVLDVKKGKMNITDSCKIHADWRNEWDSYFKNQEKQSRNVKAEKP